ncbi:MAG: sialidase family protein, partial [Longimicrobiales bacterium]
RSLCGYHGAGGVGAGTYYSDDDWRTWDTSNLVRVPNTIPNIWQTGAVEPTFVQLRDGRIWMLLRNSTERLWESFSEDLGESWSEPEPSRFYAGPNTWSTLKRLSDGSILLTWNHAMVMNPAATQDKWNFTNRDVIHGAISRDDGVSWSGFRELHRDGLRDSDEFVNYPGDKGLNESMIAELPDGRVMTSVGQAPGHRVFLVFEPTWLEERSAADDFSDGLGAWTRQMLIWRPPTYSREYHHNYNRKPGAQLVASPDGTGSSVLHIRREGDPERYSQRDGTNWNFPAGVNGRAGARVWLSAGFGGGAVSLTDRFFQPGDGQGEEMAMVRVDIGADGSVRDGGAPLQSLATLAPDRWYDLSVRWTDANDSSGRAELWIDGSRAGDLKLRRPSPAGVSYLRFRSMALNNPDPAGFYVARTNTEIGRW